MGNDQSNGGASRMAIAAMGNMTKTTKAEMMDLRDTCMRYVQRGGANKYITDKNHNEVKYNSDEPPTITRQDFHIAMTEVGIDELDFDVLDNLFTMWDETGEERVDPVLFLTGASPLASTMDVPTKLLFAMQMFDVDRTGWIRQEDMIKILAGINATASYFGDAVITPQQIEDLVEDAYKGKGGIFYLDNVVRDISSHPTVLQFASAAGTLRYKPDQTIA